MENTTGETTVKLTRKQKREIMEQEISNKETTPEGPTETTEITDLEKRLSEVQTTPETTTENAPENPIGEIGKPIEAEKTEPKTERRGRKKGGTNKPKTETQNAENNSTLDDLLGQYKTDTTVIPSNATPEMANFVNGSLFMVVLDSAFPLLLLTVMGFISPKYKNITDKGRQKLRLTNDERKLLEPSANEVVKVLFMGADPLTVFFVSLAFIYYGKIDALTDSDFNPTNKK